MKKLINLSLLTLMGFSIASPFTNVNINATNLNEKQFIVMSEEDLRTNKEIFNVDMHAHPYLSIGDFSSGHFGDLMYFVVDGEIVYCIEPDKNVNNMATSQSESGSVYNNFSPNVKELIKHFASYGNELYEESGDENYLYATQILIWKSTDPQDYNINGNTTLQPYLDEIYDLVNLHDIKVSFMSYDESKAPTHTLKWSESKSRYEVTLTDSNGVANYKLEDLKSSYGDYDITKNGDKITVSTTNENASKETIEYNYIPYGDGKNKYYDAGQDLINASADPLIMFMNFEIEETKGDLEIVKKGESLDETNDSLVNLSGVEFDLVDKDGEVVESGTTDENGKLSFTNLDKGDYTLR